MDGRSGMAGAVEDDVAVDERLEDDCGFVIEVPEEIPVDGRT